MLVCPPSARGENLAVAIKDSHDLELLAGVRVTDVRKVLHLDDLPWLVVVSGRSRDNRSRSCLDGGTAQ